MSTYIDLPPVVDEAQKSGNFEISHARSKSRLVADVAKLRAVSALARNPNTGVFGDVVQKHG